MCFCLCVCAFCNLFGSITNRSFPSPSMFSYIIPILPDIINFHVLSKFSSFSSLLPATVNSTTTSPTVTTNMPDTNRTDNENNGKKFNVTFICYITKKCYNILCLPLVFSIRDVIKETGSDSTITVESNLCHELEFQKGEIQHITCIMKTRFKKICFLL